MILDNAYLTSLLSPVRKINCKVELYEGSTLLNTFSAEDKLKSFDIGRVGEETFFGYGFCQRINVKILDPDRLLNINTASYLKVYFDGVVTTPNFYVSRVIRDENNNSLSVTAYDKIYNTSLIKVEELNLVTPYKIKDVARLCGEYLGTPLKIIGVGEKETCFDTSYPEGANLEGTENLRLILDSIAQVTQTIYFINAAGELVFRRLNKDGAADLAIQKKDYFDLDSGENRRIQTIANATQLGDNVEAHIEAVGSTVYVRDNPFWELRQDIATLLQNAIDVVGGFTLNQFELQWRGVPLLEPGDKITMETKDGKVVTSYLLNDSIQYNGGLKETTRWHYSENDTASYDNPNNLGDALNETFAKVDKVNKQVDIVVKDVNKNTNNISQLQLKTDGIGAVVEETQKSLSDNVNSINGSINELTKKVETKMSSEQVSIEIQKQLANGIDEVTTKTGFTFNEEGLRVSKTGTEISTLITEDGMRITKGREEMLVANNKGVDATNLHAKTYLIIGNNSRIEDMGPTKTGVFWIGG